MKVRGFTLIELLITLAVLAVLAVLTVPVAEMAVQRAKESELRGALREIRNAIDAYKRASDEGHIRREAGQSGYPKDLLVLVNGVPDEKDPEHTVMYFLRRVPPDPMNANPSLAPAESWAKRSYDSPPDEPKDGDDIYDVMSMSKETGLNGVPYNEW